MRGAYIKERRLYGNNIHNSFETKTVNTEFFLSEMSLLPKFPMTLEKSFHVRDNLLEKEMIYVFREV